MLLTAQLYATLALQTAALAGRVPEDIRQQLADVHEAHEAPLLLLASEEDVLEDLGRWLERSDLPHVARRLPAMGTLSYEQKVALERAELRCGIQVSATWRLESFGDCASWEDGPRSRPMGVPAAQPQGRRTDDFNRSTSLAISPLMGLGTIVDFSGELRLARRGSVAATVSAVRVREYGSPALMGIQGRRYLIGDFDRGLYGLVQAGVLSMEQGSVRSPGAAVGLGIKYTTRPGLTVDGYAGAGPGWPVRIHPALGARVGWAF